MKYFAFLISMFFYFSTHAQKQGQALVDSLLQELPKIKADTSIIKLYNRLSDLYIDIDQQKALEYAESSLAKSKNINWKRGKGASMVALGNVYNFNGNPGKAIVYLKEAATIYKELGVKFGEAASLNALAKSYERLSDYPSTIKYHTLALQIHESIPNNDLRIGISLSGIATVYYLQKDYKKSLDYYFKALEKKKVVNNKTSIANDLYAIGDTYFEIGDSVNAEKYSLQALALYDTLGNKMGLANVYAVLGKIFKKNYYKSLGYYAKAKKIYTDLNADSYTQVLTKGQVGQVFLDIYKFGDTLSPASKKLLEVPATKASLFDSATVYIKNAIEISKENEDKENEYIFLGNIAEVMELKRDYKNAYLNFKMYHFLQDSLYSQENKNKIAAVEGEREVAIRDKQIELSNISLAAQRKQKIGLIGGLALLGIIGGLLFYQSRTRKKTNTTLMVLNNELDEANKIKTKFFSILSHDLRGPVANLINFLHLQQQATDLLNKEANEVHTKKITTSAENLLENMEGLLLWSKGQMEHFTPNKKTVPVSKLFNDIENNFLGTANVKFIFENIQQLNINTDEDYLKTIMRNLTGNAVKALSNVASATIEWKAWEENGKQYLSITDNGNGITEQQINALNNSDAVVGIKTGLGFHLIRDMAKAIACSISVTAVPGKGTSFQLSI